MLCMNAFFQLIEIFFQSEKAAYAIMFGDLINVSLLITI